MKLYLDSGKYIDTEKPLDISMPLSDSDRNPRAWYVGHPRFEPVRTENYIGSIKEGGSVNFRNIFFNPHGHGTHTECLGHITEEIHSVNDVLTNYFHCATVVSILPKRIEASDGKIDFVITLDQLESVNIETKALVIRTLPNDGVKLNKNYSNSNPAYMDVACAKYLIEIGVDHLLLDLPSVDRESDNGELVFHHAFWEVPAKPNFKRTITELIFVDNKIQDGTYLMNIQMAHFENDASPSRPVLYEIREKK